MTNGYYSANQATANWGPAPINPATGTYGPTIPVSNYAGSFGDNYCGGILAGGAYLGKPHTMEFHHSVKIGLAGTAIGEPPSAERADSYPVRGRCAAFLITVALRNHPTSPV